LGPYKMAEAPNTSYLILHLWYGSEERQTQWALSKTNVLDGWMDF
jgi:hypothetical protein